jgi:hypothetical protein
MPQQPLDASSRTLVDAVFHAQEQQLLDAFRQRLDESDRRAQLAQVCGIHDEALLDHLLRLNLEPEAVAALAMIPLVVVAWADRTVQAEERQAILHAAEAAGVPPKDGRYPVLEYWLTKRPGPELFEAWKQYLGALCRQLSPEEIGELRHDLLDRARNVAAAAGGLLGFGNKISAKEQAALQALEQAFG